MMANESVPPLPARPACCRRLDTLPARHVHIIYTKYMSSISERREQVSLFTRTKRLSLGEPHIYNSSRWRATEKGVIAQGTNRASEHPNLDKTLIWIKKRHGSFYENPTSRRRVCLAVCVCNIRKALYLLRGRAVPWCRHSGQRQ